MTPDPLAEVLRTSFGLERFRPWQREAIDAVLTGSGRVLVVAPTGGGKSLTYQVPAAVLPGTTLVLSPLVALMEDQVRALEARGVPATFLASTLDPRSAATARRRCCAGSTSSCTRRPSGSRRTRSSRRSRAATCSSSRSTRRTASRSGGTTSAPTTCASARCSSGCDPRACSRARPRRRPDVRREIREQLRLGPECAEVLRGFARPNLHLSARSVDGVAEAQRRRVRGAGLGARRGGGPARRRHRLRRHAPPDRAMGRDAARAGLERGRLPRRHGAGGAHAGGDALRRSLAGTRRGDQRVRHGDRPRRHPRGRPRAAAVVDRGVLPGGRPRRPRRGRGVGAAPLLGRGHRPAPPARDDERGRVDGLDGARRAGLGALSRAPPVPRRAHVPSRLHPSLLRRRAGAARRMRPLRRLRGGRSGVGDDGADGASARARPGHRHGRADGPVGGRAGAAAGRARRRRRDAPRGGRRANAALRLHGALDVRPPARSFAGVGGRPAARAARRRLDRPHARPITPSRC